MTTTQTRPTTERDQMYGGIVLAAMLLMLSGAAQAIQGLVALLNEDFYVLGQEYMFDFNLTTWGWVHLVWGAIVLLVGIGLLSGSELARGVGIAIATISILVNFAWAPYYPLWSLTVIAFCLFASWALVARWRTED